MKRFLVICFLLPLSAFAQFHNAGFSELEDDDTNVEIGGDIFTDFNEDADSAQILEDERFFRYGRLFSLGFSTGLTSFTGNRGQAMGDDPPAWGLFISYFLNFRVSYQLGVEYSKHQMVVNGSTAEFADPPGLIEISHFRPYLGFRYHIDTSDLGTALTWSNPYLTARMEYWYQKNKFVDKQDTIPDQSGGGLGMGIGAGLEFPISIKEYYFGVEFLYHKVNFFDKFTQAFKPDDSGNSANPTQESYDDLNGDVWTLMISYIINW